MRFLRLTLIVIASSWSILTDANSGREEGLQTRDSRTDYDRRTFRVPQVKRPKRSGWRDPEDGNDCEYVDCNQCGVCNTIDCAFSCRVCCSETCTTFNCCRKTCGNQCRTHHCESECRQKCAARIHADAGGEPGDPPGENQETHNVTTIINLRNIINNTNVIDVPISLNNTNYNNITLRRTDSGNRWGWDQNKEGDSSRKCCKVLGLRHCQRVSQFPYIKCFQPTQHLCGAFCKAPVVLAQPQKFCDDRGCRDRTVYVPQPQSACRRIPIWPFIKCDASGDCQRCYHPSRRHPMDYFRCAKCFNEGGIGASPYYPRGSYYPASMAHTPPCLHTGTCVTPNVIGSPLPPPMMYYQMPPQQFGYPEPNSLPIVDNNEFDYYKTNYAPPSTANDPNFTPNNNGIPHRYEMFQNDDYMKSSNPQSTPTVKIDLSTETTEKPTTTTIGSTRSTPHISNRPTTSLSRRDILYRNRLKSMYAPNYHRSKN